MRFDHNRYHDLSRAIDELLQLSQESRIKMETIALDRFRIDRDRIVFHRISIGLQVIEYRVRFVTERHRQAFAVYHALFQIVQPSSASLG